MTRVLPALLLHGQPGGAEDWQWVRDAIGARAPTIAMQRPGYDGTPPGGVRASAEAALARLDAEGTDAAVMVGHSYGGAVAAWLAAFHPERVAGLVLVAAAANRDSLVRSDRWLAAPLVGPVACAALLWSSGLMLRVPTLRRRIAGSADLPPAFVAAEGRRSLRLDTARTFLVEQRHLLAEIPVLEAQLSAITAPTKVLIGCEDAVVPPQAGRELARRIPGAELVEIPDGGHVLTVQHPEVVAEAILDLIPVAR